VIFVILASYPGSSPAAPPLQGRSLGTKRLTRDCCAPHMDNIQSSIISTCESHLSYRRVGRLSL